MTRKLLALVTACVIGIGVSACGDSVADFGKATDVEQAAAKPGDKAGKVFERYGYTPAPPPGDLPGSTSFPTSDSTKTELDKGRR